ncbi:MAG TPA: endonuclease V [Planctomycetota bacterium]|nr:endonuclease V [Planctomycetota bacterium]
MRLQERFRRRLVRRGGPRAPRWIAAADASFDSESVYAAVVLWDARLGEVVEERTARRRLAFPYIPGLLSFREAPALLGAFRRLSRKPDLVLADGQGIAHPRGFGLACHLGLLLDVPTVGVAKSLLVGEHSALPRRAGAAVPLRFRRRTVGWALRSRIGVRPLFVSPGHRVGLPSALRLVRGTLRGFRIPEPIRAADTASKRIRAEGLTLRAGGTPRNPAPLRGAGRGPSPRDPSIDPARPRFRPRGTPRRRGA